jgi:hypothetical protein
MILLTWSPQFHLQSVDYSRSGKHWHPSIIHVHGNTIANYHHAYPEQHSKSTQSNTQHSTVQPSTVHQSNTQPNIQRTSISAQEGGKRIQARVFRKQVACHYILLGKGKQNKGTHIGQANQVGHWLVDSNQDVVSRQCTVAIHNSPCPTEHHILQ